MASAASDSGANDPGQGGALGHLFDQLGGAPTMGQDQPRFGEATSLLQTQLQDRGGVEGGLVAEDVDHLTGREVLDRKPEVVG